MQHTPTPWIAETDEKSGYVSILGPRADGNVRKSDGLGWLATINCATLSSDIMFPPMDPQDVANAAFIVQAVNSHDALLSALQLVRMSAGWAALSDETKQIVRAALASAGAK